MYEMEGASQSHSSHEPIARPTEPAERATIGRRDLGELRSTRCPPPRRGLLGWLARRVHPPPARRDPGNPRPTPPPPPRRRLRGWLPSLVNPCHEPRPPVARLRNHPAS